MFDTEERNLEIDEILPDPMSCLVTFKEQVHPRGMLLPSELKTLICEWIDYNVNYSI